MHSHNLRITYIIRQRRWRRELPASSDSRHEGSYMFYQQRWGPLHQGSKNVKTKESATGIWMKLNLLPPHCDPLFPELKSGV